MWLHFTGYIWFGLQRKQAKGCCKEEEEEAALPLWHQPRPPPPFLTSNMLDTPYSFLSTCLSLCSLCCPETCYVHGLALIAQRSMCLCLPGAVIKGLCNTPGSCPFSSCIFPGTYPSPCLVTGAYWAAPSSQYWTQHFDFSSDRDLGK